MQGRFEDLHVEERGSLRIRDDDIEMLEPEVFEGQCRRLSQ
jgi:hypothetical protein